MEDQGRTVVTITTNSGEMLPISEAICDPPQVRVKKPKQRRLIKWVPGVVFLAAMAVGLAFLFWHLAYGNNYSRFEPSLLTITATFAVFAVNFSFLEYQLSPYRALFRGIAWLHVVSATGVLLLAIVPVGFALVRASPGPILPFFLPIVAVSSVVLVLVARHCADPMQKIRSITSKRQFDRFLLRLGLAAVLEFQNTRDLKLSSILEAPSHESDYRVPPKIDFPDPFDTAHSLAFAAAVNGDVQVFDEAVEATVRMVEMATSKKSLVLQKGSNADYQVLGLVRDHARDRLIQLVRMTLETDKADRYSKAVANIFSAHLRAEAAASRQNTDFARSLMKSLTFLAVETYKRGWRATAMRTLIVARECAARGITRPPQDKDVLFEYELISFPLVMQRLAEAAMDQKDSELLFRCMETLGYLGCSAVKANKRELGKQCAQSLVQISRRSRFLKMQCFWTRCGMLPWQHARERIQWMLTWVAQISVDAQKGWLETFSEAYSRIDGKTVEIVLTLEQGKEPVSQFKRSNQPHKMTYMDSDSVTYDYSDESMLRDLEF